VVIEVTEGVSCVYDRVRRVIRLRGDSTDSRRKESLYIERRAMFNRSYYTCGNWDGEHFDCCSVS